MPNPKAYEPVKDQKFQIFTRNQRFDRAWEHCDYAVDFAEKKHLIENYRQSYGAGWEFKSIRLPRKYWPQKAAEAGATESAKKVMRRR